MPWAWIKKEFTKRWMKRGGQEHLPTLGMLRDGRRGVWQAKYWEHLIDSEEDLENDVNYVHYNPVKRPGHSPAEWPCAVGAAAVGGVIYVAHKVSQKAHEYSREVLGETASTTPATTAGGSASGGTPAGAGSAVTGDPCLLLSKEDVSQAIGVSIVETSAADGGTVLPPPKEPRLTWLPNIPLP